MCFTLVGSSLTHKHTWLERTARNKQTNTQAFDPAFTHAGLHGINPVTMQLPLSELVFLQTSWLMGMFHPVNWWLILLSKIW